MKNREKIRAALDAFQSKCGDVVVSRLKAAYGAQWRTRALLPPSLSPTAEMDAYALLFAITRNWREAFSTKFVPELKDAAHALLAGRNAWAHARDDVSDGVTFRAVSGANDIIAAFGKPEDNGHPLEVASLPVVDKSKHVPTIKKRERAAGKTTAPGYVNRNGQTVLRKTDLDGNDHLQKVYVLRCGSCQHQYGCNGSDIFQRKCPECQGGAKGLDF